MWLSYTCAPNLEGINHGDGRTAFPNFETSLDAHDERKVIACFFDLLHSDLRALPKELGFVFVGFLYFVLFLGSDKEFNATSDRDAIACLLKGRSITPNTPITRISKTRGHTIVWNCRSFDMPVAGD